MADAPGRRGFALLAQRTIKRWLVWMSLDEDGREKCRIESERGRLTVSKRWLADKLFSSRENAGRIVKSSLSAERRSGSGKE